MMLSCEIRRSLACSEYVLLHRVCVFLKRFLFSHISVHHGREMPYFVAETVYVEVRTRPVTQILTQ